VDVHVGRRCAGCRRVRRDGDRCRSAIDQVVQAVHRIEDPALDPAAVEVVSVTLLRYLALTGVQQHDGLRIEADLLRDLVGGQSAGAGRSCETRRRLAS